MDQRTLAALKGSIEKWRRIVYEGASNGGPEDCPLCQGEPRWAEVLAP